MSLGLSIFLSTVLVTLLLLYRWTRDRWNWRKLVLRVSLTVLSLIALLGLALFVYDKYENRLTKQTSYYDIALGMTVDEVQYIKGEPTSVLDESAKEDAQSKTEDDEAFLKRIGAKPVDPYAEYQKPSDPYAEFQMPASNKAQRAQPTAEEERGKQGAIAPVPEGYRLVIKTGDIKKGKSIHDFHDWQYDLRRDESVRLDVSFSNRTGTIYKIGCYGKEIFSCHSILGVHVGMSEEDVVERLRTPTHQQLGDGTKTLEYRNLNLLLWFSQKNLYMIEVVDFDESTNLQHTVANPRTK